MKGFMLYSGIEYETDKEQGLQLLTRAADAGYNKACMMLIDYYSAKQTADPAKALHYKEIALATGELMYAYEVARSYEKGKIVEADGDKASLYYAKLATAEEKSGKQKKALKNLKKFSSDGVHWDTRKTKKLRKKRQAEQKKEISVREEAETAVQDALAEDDAKNK